MSAVETQEATTTASAAPGGAETPAAEPRTPAEEPSQLEERRRDAYRVG